jgi:hypothetical protein
MYIFRLKNLEEQGVIKDQMLTSLFVHSDNAAQHFKSPKSLHWLSKQLESMDFTSVMWDFGPPGHGKVSVHYIRNIFYKSNLLRKFLQGMYDGLGGILKNWIVQRKVSRLTFDTNDPTMRCPTATREDPTMRCPTATPETEDLMGSAEECCSAWKSHFETEKWRAEAAVSARKVKAFFFHWGAEGAILRPAADEQFDRLVGISSSYQYFMLREGEVLMRNYSC